MNKQLAFTTFTVAYKGAKALTSKFVILPYEGKEDKVREILRQEQQKFCSYSDSEKRKSTLEELLKDLADIIPTESA